MVLVQLGIKYVPYLSVDSIFGSPEQLSMDMRILVMVLEITLLPM